MSLHFFSHVDGLSGAHILCIGFPNSHNFLNRFYSRCWNPVCEGVDAFCYYWVGENNWLASPVSLVPRVIRNLVHCKAVGTLIVLAWVSSPFWPVLLGSGLLTIPLSRASLLILMLGRMLNAQFQGFASASACDSDNLVFA